MNLIVTPLLIAAAIITLIFLALPAPYPSDAPSPPDESASMSNGWNQG